MSKNKRLYFMALFFVAISALISAYFKQNGFVIFDLLFMALILFFVKCDRE